MADYTSATERLILKYQDRIYNVILRMCANADDAAELTQETFVKVIQSIDKFEGRSGFYTWAFRIAVNLTLNYCRRNARYKHGSLDSDADRDDGDAKGQLKRLLSDDSSPDPAAVAANKELCEIVAGSVMKLPNSQRAVIVLRDVEGMSYARIAEVLDIELGTLKSRLSRARSNLREQLEAILQ